MSSLRGRGSGCTPALIGLVGALVLSAGAACAQSTDDKTTPPLPPMTPQQKAAVEAALKVRQKKAATGSPNAADPNNGRPVTSTPGNGNPAVSQPGVTQPTVSQPTVSQPQVSQPTVAPMTIVPAQPVRGTGFSRPYSTGFSYQGPRYFTRPFMDGVRFNGDPARKPKLKTRSPMVEPLAGIPANTANLPTVSEPITTIGERGAWRGYSPVTDPFSTRYPITESFHTVVNSQGQITSFTTVNPVTGYARSYNDGSVNGWDVLRYNSDRFRMRAIIRNGFLYDPYRGMPRCCASGVYVAPGGTIEDYLASMPEPVMDPQSTPVATPPDPLEEAKIALGAGRAEMAVPRLRELRMANPDDMELRRILALTLVINRDVPQGIAELAGAYATDPGLAAVPVDYQAFNIRGSALTDATGRLVSYGKRNREPLAYFAAAVIQQARGELPTARKMLELSISAGLDRDLANAMSGALAPAAR